MYRLKLDVRWDVSFVLHTKEGFVRQLKASEIEGQLLTVERYTGEKISNIVYME